VDHNVSVDTSGEAVEHVCAAFLVMLGRYEAGAIERELFTATMEKLRALVAERDALKADGSVYALLADAVAERDRMRAALQMLHDNTAEYQRINHLGGYDNHDMRVARAALNGGTIG
jgi:hypothetical protein